MDESKLRSFQIFLRVYGWLSLFLFAGLLAGFTLELSAMNPGGSLSWLAWGPVTDPVPPMLLAVYVVWSIYIIRAARDPLANRTFLEFTVWANVAHGIGMIPHALGAPEFRVKFLTDIPWVFLPAIAWFALRPSSMRK